MIKNFISNLFRNPKGNGIVRQVRRAEHKVAVEQAKKATEMAAGSSVAVGGTMIASSLIHGAPNQIPVLPQVLAVNLTTLFGRGARSGIKDAVKNCNSLKASNEYQAILDRATKIKNK